MRARGWVWVAMALSGASSPAVAETPLGPPLLRLETGMHTATIRRIATDAAGRWAVTASEDKTARVWEVATGRLVRVLRPPQGEGNEGKLYAVAMSPDGATVAVGGWTGFTWSQVGSIYIFDRESGHVVDRLKGLPNVVNHLVYSPDGRWLAASLGDGHGVRVFDIRSSEARGSDGPYGDDSFSADFDHEGRRLVTTSADGLVRVYGFLEGRLSLLQIARLGSAQPFAARFSPDGRRIAVGFEETPGVLLLDAETLRVVASFPMPRASSGGLSKVAWSSDGQALVAGGTWDVRGDNPVRRWTAPFTAPPTDEVVATNTVVDLVALPAAAVAGWLFAAQDPAWGVLAADGRVLRRQNAAVADLRDQIQALRVSADGDRVRFGYLYRGGEPRTLDLRSGGLGPDTLDLAEPVTAAPGLDIVGWNNRQVPTCNGHPLPLERSEMSRSLAIVPGAQRFVLGTEWSLRFFDRAGTAVWSKPVPGATWAVNATPDGRFIIAAYGDGTLRWHRVEDGREILAFFPHADRERWVVWTPEGFYAASPGAEDLIGYHLDQGPGREGDFVSAAQLREHYYRPELIAHRLDPDGDRLLADAVARTGDVRETLTTGAPELVLESLAEATVDREYTLKVRVRGARPGEGRFIVRVDGYEVAARWNAPSTTPGGVHAATLELTPGPHTITTERLGARQGTAPLTALVDVRPSASAPPAALHVLAVGISRYRASALDKGVLFAAADAAAVAGALAKLGKALHPSLRPPIVLRDAQATRDAIETQGRAMAKAVRPGDTVVVYLAGHGETIDGDFHFLPWDVDPARARDTSLDARRLRDLLAQLPSGNLLLIIDACSSGSFDASIERLARLSGRMVMAAAAPDGAALEGKGGHGVLTGELLEALEGRARRGDDIRVFEIADHLDSAVPAITGQRGPVVQRPVFHHGGLGFPVVRRPGR